MHSRCLAVSIMPILSQNFDLLVHGAVAALEDGGGPEVAGDLAADVVAEEQAARAVAVVEVGFATALGKILVFLAGGGES